MKRLFLFLLCCVLLFALVPATNAQQNVIDYEKLQSPAIEAFSIFATRFLLDEGRLPKTYPEWYGGAYMDDEFCLCIKVVDHYDNVSEFIENDLKEYPIKCLTTTVSYNELQTIQEEITLECVGWTSILLSQQDSKVVIRLDESDEQSECLKHELSSKYDNIRFEYAPAPIPFVAVVGGNPLSTSGDSGFGTIGFSSTYYLGNSQVSGILTAGHVALGGSLYIGTGTSYPCGNTSSNSIIQYSNNERGDYAFIPANGNTLTNNVRITSSTTTTITAAYTDLYSIELTGTYVVKYGNTTGLTNGRLTGPTSISYSDSGNITTILGVWEVEHDDVFSISNPIASPGDSGAPVWQTVSGTKYLMGILSGGYLDENNSLTGKRFFFTPLSIIEQDVDFSLTLS